jgi:hypothetical protein
MITKQQAGALAVLGQTIRPKWDTRAITDALAEFKDRDLADVATAVIRAAEDPSILTPKGITFDRKPAEPAARRYPRFVPEPKPEGVDVHAWAARVRVEIRPGRPRFDPASIHDHVGEEGDE